MPEASIAFPAGQTARAKATTNRPNARIMKPTTRNFFKPQLACSPERVTNNVLGLYVPAYWSGFRQLSAIKPQKIAVDPTPFRQVTLVRTGRATVYLARRRHEHAESDGHELLISSTRPRRISASQEESSQSGVRLPARCNDEDGI